MKTSGNGGVGVDRAVVAGVGRLGSDGLELAGITVGARVCSLSGHRLELAGHAVFALRLSRTILPFACDTTVRGFGESDTEEGKDKEQAWAHIYLVQDVSEGLARYSPAPQQTLQPASEAFPVGQLAVG